MRGIPPMQRVRMHTHGMTKKERDVERKREREKEREVQFIHILGHGFPESIQERM